MLDGLEGVDGRPRHPLGGAVRGDQVGELGLERLELPHERVVLRVRDLGTRLHVVEIVVVVNALVQLGDPLRRVRPRHAAQHSTGTGTVGRAPRVGIPLSGYTAADDGSPRSIGRVIGDTTMPKTSTLKKAPVGGTTASVQDYLAAIYDLASSGKPVIGARLAKHMAISAPAVTESIQRLVRGGYVKVGRGKELILTGKGRQIAEVMARRHRLLERWLTDKLGLNWTDAHEEAHRLEHAISPRVEDRLAEMLGMPSTCPHGNPIPGMAKTARVSAVPAGPGAGRHRPSWSSGSPRRRRPTRICSSISGGNNVRPGRRVKITEVAPWAGTITASGDGQSIDARLARRRQDLGVPADRLGVADNRRGATR